MSRAPSLSGPLPGPFHPRLEAASTAKDWADWAGVLSPRKLDATGREYFAIRNQAALIDISPMRKYRVEGPDAERVLNRVVTRDVSKIAPGRVGYALWCDEDGMTIDDGTIFRLGQDCFRLCCQERMLTWLLDAAGGFDAAVSDETEALAALALQGPTSFAVLEAAGFDVAALRPFDLAAPEPGLLVSRTGFTGDLGYELWTTPGGALALWDRLIEAGRTFGILPAGMEALDMARIEAGFPMTGVDFQSIHAAERPSRGRTPFELGLGRHVDFAKGHFNGRRALLALKDAPPKRRLVTLDIEGSRAASGALLYRRGMFGRWREVGHVTSALWSPTAKRNIAFAEIEGAAEGADLFAEIYLFKEGKWERRMARARPGPRAAFRPDRARATPPARR